MGKVTGVIVLALIVVIAPPSVLADWKDEIGHTQLANELGGMLPTGAWISASQVEAFSGDHYAPNTEDGQFTDKTITLRSGDTGGSSSHATSVGRYLYGNTTSIATGIDTIDSWSADNWLSTGFLKTASTLEPGIEFQDVQNHSWIGSYESVSNAIDALRRFDYTINRDNYVAVVGVNNVNDTTIPQLLGHSYNAISVGRSTGAHSHGFTTIDGVGRNKPEIVAPASFTSISTPMVGSAAALLLEAGAGTQAENSEAIKAMLLAGATKHEFIDWAYSDWSRTHTQPLDERVGAGELNVCRSYHILDAGEQESSVTSNVGQLGWDFETQFSSTSDDLLYFFEVAEDDVLHEMSVILTWNRVITEKGAGWSSPQSSLADLSLELWDATDFTLGTKLDYSESAVDNVEHIYYEQLQPGQYAIRVLDAASTEFALAWSGTDYSIMGDLNLDGLVNGDGTGPIESDDLAAFIAGWRHEHAQANVVAWKEGDLNLDGITDLRDFALLRDAHSGAGAIAGLLLGAGAIPEPSSALLAALVIAAWIGLSWRRKS